MYSKSNLSAQENQTQPISVWGLRMRWLKIKENSWAIFFLSINKVTTTYAALLFHDLSALLTEKIYKLIIQNISNFTVSITL